MKLPKLSKLEIQILEALWAKGPLPIREIQESLPDAKRLAYTTVQTMVYRLETKAALRRSKKIGNAHIFEAVLSPRAVRGRMIDDLINLFGGGPGLLMAHLVEAGKLTKDDIAEAEKALLKFEQKGKAK